MREDINHPDQEGIAYLTFNIGRGRRQSSAVAFLTPAVRKRPNLTILSGALAQRVVLDGTRATGVIVTHGGQTQQFRAGREVIVSAGALNTPKLLHLSGIGPAQHLQSLGVDVRVDSPDVGRNMSEHLLTWLQYWLKDGRDSTNTAFAGLPLALNTLRYMLFRKGVLATGSSDIGGFIRTRPGLDRPDAQIMMDPYSLDFSTPTMAFDQRPGMQFFVYPLRPESRGTVMARSTNPEDPPLIRPNYLATENDRATVVAAFRFVRRLAAQPALARIRRRGEDTGSGRADRRRDRRRLPHARPERVSRDGHLSHGGGCGRRTRWAIACAWDGRPARRRPVRRARPGLRQHECADDGDRGSRLRLDPGRRESDAVNSRAGRDARKRRGSVLASRLPDPQISNRRANSRRRRSSCRCRSAAVTVRTPRGSALSRSCKGTTWLVI